MRCKARKLLFFIIAAFFSIKATSLHARPYAQLSSLNTQLPAIAGSSLVKMDSVDVINNMQITPKLDKVIIEEPGIYCIISAAQVGTTAHGVTGYVDIWLEKNDKDLPNSNARMSIERSTVTGVLISQTVLPLEKGDTIGTRYAASGPSLGFIFIDPKNEPAIPSLIFSIFKVD